MGIYLTWELIGDRWEKAMTDCYLPAPVPEAVSPGFRPSQSLECPHRFARPARDVKLCANCSQSSPESLSGGHRGGATGLTRTARVNHAVA